MKLLRRLGLVLVALLLAAAGVILWAAFRKEPPLPPPPRPFAVTTLSGAAVLYTQAFAAMPELTKAENRALGNRADTFDPQVTRQAVERFGPALDLVTRGTRQLACDWGLDLNQGFPKPLQHLRPSMECVRALAWRARLRLQAGDSEGAVDDLLAGFRLSRALGEPPLVIGLLVRGTMDQVLLRVAAGELNRFSPAALQRLQKGIAALPPERPLADALDWNREMIAVSLYAQVMEIRKNAARAPLRDRCFYNIASLAVSWAPVRLRWGSAKDLLQWTDSTATVYEAVSGELRKPFAEGRAGIEAVIARERDNPFVAMMGNEFPRMREKECQSDALWAVFHAAVDARLNAPGTERARIAALCDPVSGNPVATIEMPGGIKVSFPSAFSERVVSLTVAIDPSTP